MNAILQLLEMKPYKTCSNLLAVEQVTTHIRLFRQREWKLPANSYRTRIYFITSSDTVLIIKAFSVYTLKIIKFPQGLRVTIPGETQDSR